MRKVFPAKRSAPRTARSQGASAEPQGQQNSHQSALRSAARNGIWGGFGAIVAAVLGFALTALVARALGAHGTGLFFSATAIATITIGIATAGADTGMLWALPRDRVNNESRGLRGLLVIGLVPVVLLSALLSATAWALSHWLAAQMYPNDSPTAEAVLQVLTVAIALGPLSQILTQGSRALGSVKPFVLVQQVGLPGLRVMGVLVIVWVAVPSVDLFAWAWASPLLLTIFTAGWFVAQRVRTAERLSGVRAQRPSKDLAVTFWRFAILRGLGNSCALALTWLDVVLVAVLSSPTQAGIYAVASRLASSGQLALQAMRLGIAPQISAAFARNSLDRVGVLYATTTGWAVLVSWPIFVTLAAFGPIVLRLFGHGFAAGAPPLAILSLAMMFNVATGNVGTLLLMSGKSSWALWTSASALACNIGLDLMLIPSLGAVGAALGWAASIVVQNALGVWLTRRNFGVRAHGRSFWTNAACCLVIPGTTALLVRVTMGLSISALCVQLLAAGTAMAWYATSRRENLKLDSLRLRSLDEPISRRRR